MSNELFYYEKFDFPIDPLKYNGSNGHIILEPFATGLNNRRMTMEMAIAICYITNKKLVINKILPAFFGMPKGRHLDEIFDFGDLAPFVLSFKEFCDSKNIEECYSEIKKISYFYNEKTTGKVLSISEEKLSDSAYQNKKILNLCDVCQHENIVFDKNLFGIFYLCVYSEKMNDIKKIIAQNFRYKKDTFDIAQKFIQIIGDKNYYSMHVRRTDFLKAYPSAVTSPEKMLEFHGKSIPKGSLIYIATDEKPEFFEVLKEKYKIIFYQDLANQLNQSYQNAWWIPLVEQLICSRGIKFIGTKYSTFSNYIYRLRGYMSDIEDKNYLVINEFLNQNQQLEYQGKPNQGAIFWQREFSNAWNFDD